MTDRIKKVRRARLGEITDFFAEEEIRAGDPVVCERTKKTVVFDDVENAFAVAPRKSYTKLMVHVSVPSYPMAQKYKLLLRRTRAVRRLGFLLEVLAFVLCLAAGIQMFLSLSV